MFFYQFLFNNPATLPVWLGGLCFYLITDKGRPYRLFGVAYLALLAIMVLAGSSRPDRIAGAYPMLLAAGAVWWEGLAGRGSRRWMKPALVSLIILGGAMLAPLCLPILSPERTARYTQTLGLVPQLERGKTSPLPQWLADRFDWEEMLRTVAGVYHNLTPEEQSKAVIAALRARWSDRAIPQGASAAARDQHP